MMLTPSLLFEVSNGQRAIPSLAFRVREGLRSGYEPAPSQTITRLAYYPWLIVGTTCIGAFVGQIDASIVQLALPTLERVFDARLGAVSWVAIGYSVAFASILPVFARLAEMFGRKMLYLAGFVFFTAASACDPEHYGAFLLKAVDFIALEFRKRFAESKILITPGNNDQYCQDYSIEANGPSLATPPKGPVTWPRKASNSAPAGVAGKLPRGTSNPARSANPITEHHLLVRQFSRWLCSGQFHGPGDLLNWLKPSSHTKKSGSCFTFLPASRAGRQHITGTARTRRARVPMYLCGSLSGRRGSTTCSSDSRARSWRASPATLTQMTSE